MHHSQTTHFILLSPPPPSVIWTWSLMQFTLVLSATHAPKTRPSINYPPPKDMIDEMTPVDRMVHDFGEGDGLLRPSVTCSPNIDLFLDMDIIAILTTVFMQDGPFFLLRFLSRWIRNH